METISSNRPKIVVIGSCNTDMVVKANRLPVPGETILGGTFYMNPGGKGANQAIAAARLGAEVTFISKIGYDLFGLQALEIYRSEKINTEFIFTDQKSPSGVALISVDSFGENSIIVAPGASRSLSTEDINKAEEKIKEADIILMQLEVPIDTVEYAATIANRYGKKVILNPAPAHAISLTHIATQSIPIVSCLSIRNASFNFVPTPSVPDTKVGFSMFLNFSMENAPENPPRPVKTSGRMVPCTYFFISSTDL